MSSTAKSFSFLCSNSFISNFHSSKLSCFCSMIRCYVFKKVFVSRDAFKTFYLLPRHDMNKRSINSLKLHTLKCMVAIVGKPAYCAIIFVTLKL